MRHHTGAREGSDSLPLRTLASLFALLACAPIVRAEEPPPAAQPSALPPLDFDLLGDLPPSRPLVKAVDEAAIAQRRFMLDVHQTLGIGLAAGMAGSLVTGQLNYNDKFVDGNSERFALSHKLFTYPSIGLGALVAGLALFVPDPLGHEGDGFDRRTLHKIGEYLAGAGWAAQLALGLWTASSEGRVDQQTLAFTHLVVGYVSLAGMLVGIGANVF